MEHSKFSPKDFFLHLGLVAALYVSVASVLVLLFQYIDVLFPDPLENAYRGFSGPIRFAMSALIVAFPLLALFTRMTNVRAREESERLNFLVRKWLLYLTLFIAGAVIAGDLVALINTFLGGEMTIRFVLKVIAVFVVFGAVFFYYLYDLKEYWKERKKKSQNVGLVAGVVMLAVVVSGFFIIGSPWTQRLARFDERRVSDLQSIQWQIVNYWQMKGEIPAALSELEDSISGFRVPADPDTKAPYGYRKTGALSFDLCATFNLERESLSGETAPVPVRLSVKQAHDPYIIWSHPAGDYCFQRTIDPDLYPVREK